MYLHIPHPLPITHNDVDHFFNENRPANEHMLVNCIDPTSHYTDVDLFFLSHKWVNHRVFAGKMHRSIDGCNTLTHKQS